jgi:hypothetical protein
LELLQSDVSFLPPRQTLLFSMTARKLELSGSLLMSLRGKSALESGLLRSGIERRKESASVDLGSCCA